MKSRLKRLFARAKPNAGFTLAETLVVIFVLCAVATLGYALLRDTLRRHEQLRERSGLESELAVASALLSRDLRNAYVVPNDAQTRFIGRPDDGGLNEAVDFCRRADVTRAGSADEVGYLLREDARGVVTLWRRTQSGVDADPLAGGRLTRVASPVAAFDMRYSDGHAWNESWGWDGARERPFEGIRGLPLAVAVTLTVGSSTRRSETVRFVVPVMAAVLNRELMAKRGFAGVLVLWLLAGASIAALGALSVARRTDIRSALLISQAQALYLAHAAALLAHDDDFGSPRAIYRFNGGTAAVERVSRDTEETMRIRIDVTSKGFSQAVDVGWKKVSGQWHVEYWKEAV